MGAISPGPDCPSIGQYAIVGQNGGGSVDSNGLRVERRAATLRLQVEDRLRKAIASGRLKHSAVEIRAIAAIKVGDAGGEFAS
jgi:hypothetical protein